MSWPTNRTVVEKVLVGTGSAATLLPPDSDRNGFTLHNVSGVLFVKLGSGASPNSFSFRLNGKATLAWNDYIGVVTAIKQSPDSPSYVYVTDII